MLMVLGNGETEGCSGQEQEPWGQKNRRDLVTSIRSMAFFSFPAGTCLSPSTGLYGGISMTKFNNQELISNYPNWTCINPKLNGNKPILCSKSETHQTEAEGQKSVSGILSGKRRNANRHNAKRHNAKRHNAKRHNANRHNAKRHNANRFNAKRYNADRHNANRHHAKRHNANRHNAKRHNAKRHNA